MNKDATVHARMDERIKSEALEVFDALGLSVSEAITLFFKQVALKQAIPFELSVNKALPQSSGSKISDYKKEDLKSVLDVIPDSVDELWVFGSAVTPYCRPDSDLDVCIIGDSITKEDRKLLIHAPRHAMDLLDVTHEIFAKESKEPGNVFYEVANKGVLVYKKGVGIING